MNTYTLTLSAQQIDGILSALMEQPYKSAAPTIAAIQQQIVAARRAAAAEKAKPANDDATVTVDAAPEAAE